MKTRLELGALATQALTSSVATAMATRRDIVVLALTPGGCSVVLWLYLFVMVPRMNRALSRTRHPRGKKTERRLERCAPAVVRRMERKQQWCSAVESILEVAFERHSAMVSLLYMMGVQTSTNAAFASVLYSVVAAAVLCTYRAGGEDFKYNVKVSLNFPLDRPTNIF